MAFSLAEVQAVAQRHPFYNPEAQYPPSAETVKEIRELLIGQETKSNLEKQPLLDKKTLYKAIERLTHDVSPENNYRYSSYMSITGGGSGGVPMLFAVDTLENRQHRAQMGEFLKATRVIESGDWVLSTHLAGSFYRSLDLITEMMENAGATVLSAGSYMPPADVAKALADYHVNVLTSDGCQVIQVVQQIAMMEQVDRDRICLNKIIYTSEPLNSPQREFIKSVLGDVKILSILGSSEAGAWSISNPDLTGKHGIVNGCVDFVFDTRHILIEIFPLSVSESVPPSDLTALPDGEQGIIVQTSLQRLRNPLVRYITGDIGSLHMLPEDAQSKIPGADWEHLRVLRMQGRDQRFSFKWYACYFEFDKIESLMQTEEYGILKWQVVLDRLQDTPESTLEIRLFRCHPRENIVSDEELKQRLGEFFAFFPENAHLSRIVFLNDLEGFERSATAGKIIKFVNRWH